MWRRRVSLHLLTSEIKLKILSQALSVVSIEHLLCTYRVLLCNIFTGDTIGFNSCIYDVSHKSLRCLGDLKCASTNLTRLVRCPMLGIQFANDHLKFLCTRHYEHLLQCFLDAGVAVNWDRDGFAPIDFAYNPPVCIGLYAARRGKTHSMPEVHAGLIACFDLSRDVFNPLCVNRDSVRRSERKGHLTKPHVDELLSGRDIGVFVCMFILGKRAVGHVSLGEINHKGKPTRQHYYKVPFTQKHVFDIWAAWD